MMGDLIKFWRKMGKEIREKRGIDVKMEKYYECDSFKYDRGIDSKNLLVLT